MLFEITREYIDSIKEAIADGRDSFLQGLFVEMHPADISEIFEHLRASEANYIFKILEKEQAAEVMIELNEDAREKLLATLTSQEIAEQVIDNIDTDDAVDVISELPENKKEEVIAHITDEEQKSDIRDLLRYSENTAGGLMATELVKVHADWTIARAIREMRKQAESVDEVYSIYVVDREEKLIGTLSLKRLLFSSSSIKTPISEIIDEQQPHYVFADVPGEEAAQRMEKYDLVALPVLDHEMRLLGRITIDDVVDLIREVAERDYQRASGISETVEYTDNVWMLTRARLPWLLIGMLGGILVAQVLGFFEEEVAAIGSLVLFMPLIGAMGGNAGVQSSAIVVQSLANKSFKKGNISRKLLKELGVALINGITCGGIIMLYSIIFANSMALSYTVGTALFTVILVASVFGTAVPLLLDKLNIDPAVATGPFITTTNDLIGMTVYFSIAQFYFNY